MNVVSWRGTSFNGGCLLMEEIFRWRLEFFLDVIFRRISFSNEGYLTIRKEVIFQGEGFLFNNCLCIVLTIVNFPEIFNPTLSSNLCDLRVHLTSDQYCTANQWPVLQQLPWKKLQCLDQVNMEYLAQRDIKANIITQIYISIFSDLSNIVIIFLLKWWSSAN